MIDMYSIILSLIVNILVAAASDLDALASMLSKPETVKFAVSDDFGASMDCLQIFKSTSADDEKLYGVYHNFNSTTNSWNIYLAESDNAPAGPWIRIQTLVEKSGSMPFVHTDAQTGSYILAYEHMDPSGNFPILLFYSSMSSLLQGQASHLTTLMKEVHTAASPNTYTNDVQGAIVNVGTPSITAAQYIDNTWMIYLRFHFTTKSAPEYDTPGFGVVTYKPSMEVNGVYFNWQAFFDNDANNAIEIARDVKGGKIGQRANVRYRGRLYYLYEAQLNSNFDWHNWRLFLYSADENRAVTVPLSIDGIVDFANPSVAQLEDRTMVTLFVPSEGISADSPPADRPGCLVYTLPVLE